MKRARLLFLSLLLFFTFSAFCQTPELFRNYTSLRYNEDLVKNDVVTIKAIAKLEKKIAHFVRYGDFQERSIPIVIHVLYAEERERIPERQIREQINALNDHFALAEVIKNHPNDPKNIHLQKAVDTQIRFCIATKDENDKPLEGIRYVETKVKVWEDLEEIKKNKDGSKPANQNKFLNIWIAHLPDDNTGFAQMPGRKKSTDGIVIDFRYFGFTEHPQYGGAKTLTYLTGQYLGLYPLTGFTTERNCTDDFVADTPRSNVRNTGCPAYEHVSICDGEYVLEATMNFLSTTDDNCRYMFTRGQAARMHVYIS